MAGNMEGITIKGWAEEDRPREKLIEKGRRALTEAELLAIIIGSGSKTQTAVDLAKNILHHVNNNLNELSKLNMEDLTQFKGIGEAKAISIMAALELGRRRRHIEDAKRLTIKSSNDAYEIVKSFLLDLPHEEFWVLLLNNSNTVVAKKLVSKGGVTSTVVDAKIIFKAAVEKLASSIIICHNHPSGNLQPSNEDINITLKLVEAGKFIGIKLIDHLIVTDSGYYSFADEGKL